MDIEVVVLTGGASSRMGVDKASLPIDGVPLAVAVVDSLKALGLSVTVVGRQPIQGAAFVRDAEAFGGPLRALSGFKPCERFVFVCACDLPLFDPRVVSALLGIIGDSDAVIPSVDGRLQPLCAAYRSEAFNLIMAVMQEDKNSIMAWIRRLKVVEADADALIALGIHPASVQGVNTPQELQDALAKRLLRNTRMRETSD